MENSSLSNGDSDVTEKPVDPIKVYSEKELIREFEKIASTRVPEKDWSVRIGAMQKVEGLVIGGSFRKPRLKNKWMFGGFMIDPQEVSKGSGFVAFTTPEDATKVKQEHFTAAFSSPSS
ncbi:CLIP-associated protein [Camellia lanceoleosa]|uniref:CLIP-associated protein n=1 Tax=Camellia lanceoleosa TaxID=1840588 RepID=A0ACC0H383_9ERIC|nr:CLIP-associated protein [Camellia lanceoleosa]